MKFTIVRSAADFTGAVHHFLTARCAQDAKYAKKDIMTAGRRRSQSACTNLKLGFLLNWNVPLMKDGIKRMVNNLEQ